MRRSLSGRFVILTLVVVALAEVLILIPSVARYRIEYLNARLERAQIASLALLATESIGPEVAEELLRNAEVYNVVLRRDLSRQLILSSPVPKMISGSYDLRTVSTWQMLRDGVMQLMDGGDNVIRVIGAPVQQAGIEIEITLDSKPLCNEMWAYLWETSRIITAVAVVLVLLTLFFARLLVLSPIKRLIASMQAYADKPQDARQVIIPQSPITEIKDAELALQSMQTDLTAALRQQERLAALGTSVAKISHDLRNILTTAQLLADAFEMSEDPIVQKMSPKLMAAVSRAAALTEATLAYGRADEAAPNLEPMCLHELAEEVLDLERLSAPEGVDLKCAAQGQFCAKVDRDQMLRALSNLIRNAVQAMAQSDMRGDVTVQLSKGDDVILDIIDQGPGLPPKAQTHLFEPFRGRQRQGGTGLGLSIAHELVALQGGSLSLLSTSPEGTTFRITLPKHETC